MREQLPGAGEWLVQWVSRESAYIQNTLGNSLQTRAEIVRVGADLYVAIYVKAGHHETSVVCLNDAEVLEWRCCSATVNDITRIQVLDAVATSARHTSGKDQIFMSQLRRVAALYGITDAEVEACWGGRDASKWRKTAADDGTNL